MRRREEESEEEGEGEERGERERREEGEEREREGREEMMTDRVVLMIDSGSVTGCTIARALSNLLW